MSRLLFDAVESCGGRIPAAGNATRVVPIKVYICFIVGSVIRGLSSYHILGVVAVAYVPWVIPIDTSIWRNGSGPPIVKTECDSGERKHIKGASVCGYRDSLAPDFVCLTLGRNRL